MTDTERYDLTVADAARLLGVHADTVRRWAEADALPSWRTPGGQRRFRRSDVLALMPPPPADEPEEKAS